METEPSAITETSVNPKNTKHYHPVREDTYLPHTHIRHTFNAHVTSDTSEMSLVVNSKRWSALRVLPCETVTCIIISLVSAACSIHSNWEVVVWDGALPGGGGMQDTPWQLWLDVLRWQQDQNHQGKRTSSDRGKWDVAKQKCTAPLCLAWHRQNNVFGMNSAVKKTNYHWIYPPFFVRTRSHTPHQRINTLEKVRWNAASSRSAALFLQIFALSPAPFIALFC